MTKNTASDGGRP